jgi:hypothetical protein
MPDSYPTSWKEPYCRALRESDEHKLTEFVQAAEYAIVLRLQEFENSTDHHEERIEMKRAAADLLVKTYKLGWPALRCSNSYARRSTSLARQESQDRMCSRTSALIGIRRYSHKSGVWTS